MYTKATSLSIASLKSYAVQLGLDPARFNQCLDSGEMKGKVAASQASAFQNGFPGTPAFLINASKLIGSQGFEVMKPLIDAALAKKKGG